MRKAFVFSLLAAASVCFAAEEQQQTRSEQKKHNADEKPAAEAAGPQERTRVEGAAGGTAPVPESKRRSVGAGAGPHLRDNLPSPAKLPRDKPVEPPK